MQFKIAKDQIQHCWAIYRVGGNKDQHAHFGRYAACKRLEKILKAGECPYSPWYQEAARRLLTHEEYIALRKPKDRYHNRPRR